jgi:hypothetical protein
VVKWQEFSEDGFRLAIPASMRRTRLGPLFRGAIVKGAPETQLLVNFDSTVNDSIISEWRSASLKPPPFTEWGGLKWTYYSWGLFKHSCGRL